MVFSKIETSLTIEKEVTLLTHMTYTLCWLKARSSIRRRWTYHNFRSTYLAATRPIKSSIRNLILPCFRQGDRSHLRCEICWRPRHHRLETFLKRARSRRMLKRRTKFHSPSIIPKPIVMQSGVGTILN